MVGGWPALARRGEVKPVRWGGGYLGKGFFYDLKRNKGTRYIIIHLSLIIMMAHAFTPRTGEAEAGRSL